MDKNRYFQIRSGKYIKTKIVDIQRLYSKWLWLVMAVYKPSFADAKPLEYGSQDFVGGDFADDGAEVVKGLPDVLADQIGSQT